MRPRMKVLMYALNPLTLDTTAFALRLRDFAVATSQTEMEFRELFVELRPRAAVFIQETEPAPIHDLLLWVKERDPEARTMVVIRSTSCLWQFDHADRVLSQQDSDMATLRYSLKILAGRKRGPKKRPVAAQPIPESEVVCA